MNTSVRELFHFLAHLHLSSCNDQWLRECIHTSLSPKPIQNVKDEPETDPSLSNDCPFILELQKDNSLFLISFFKWSNSREMWSDWSIRRAWRSGLAYLDNHVPPYFYTTENGTPSPIHQFADLAQSYLGKTYQTDIFSDHNYKQISIKSDDSITLLFYDDSDLFLASKFSDSDYGFCISNNHDSNSFEFRVATGVTRDDSLDVPHVMREMFLVRPENTTWSTSTRLSDRRIHTILRSNSLMSTPDYDSALCDDRSSMITKWVSMLPMDFKPPLGDVLETDSRFFRTALYEG